MGNKTIQIFVVMLISSILGGAIGPLIAELFSGGLVLSLILGLLISEIGVTSFEIGVTSLDSTFD